MSRTFVVKATVGADAPERCVQALTVAAVAVASGLTVSLWLTGEASWLSLPGQAGQLVVAHSAPLDELLDAVLTGGRVTVCSQCAARRELVVEMLLPGVRVAGAQVFVAEAAADGAQALVY